MKRTLVLLALMCFFSDRFREMLGSNVITLGIWLLGEEPHDMPDIEQRVMEALHHEMQNRRGIPI